MITDLANNRFCEEKNVLIFDIFLLKIRALQ